MKRLRQIQWALPAMIVLSIAAACPVFAADGEVTIGSQWYTQTTREPKWFDEYRDITNGPMIESFVILDKIDGGRYSLTGTNVLKHDQSEALMYRRPRFTVGVSYKEIPHNLSWNTKTPYARIGPGVYVLPDAVQRRIQSDSASTSARTADLQSLLAGARTEPMGFRTDVTRALLKGRIANGLQLDIRGSRRMRQGDKTYSITLGGFSNVVEIPEDINQQIVTGEAKLSYVKKRLVLEASGGLEGFINEVDALIVDNPRIASDSTIGSSRGRLDLYPDNRTVRGALRAGLELPHHSVFNAYAGISETKQDDRFLPYTINSALPVFALPSPDAHAKAVTVTQDYRLHSSPSRFLNTTLRFRRNDYENKTAFHTFPAEILYDQSVVVGDIENERFEYARSTGGLDLDLTPVSRLVLGGTAEYTWRTRSIREVTKDKELAFEGHVNYHPSISGLVLEGRYRHGDRRLNHTPIAELADEGEQPNLRRFDVGDRNQDWGRARLGFQPNGRSDISAYYEYIRNKYEDQRLDGIGAIASPTDTIGQLGLLDETRRNVGANLSYELTKQITLRGGVGYSKLYTNQRSRTSPATVTQVADSTWQARIVDRFVFGNAAVEWRPKADRLSFGATWELERTPTSYDLSSIGLRPPAQDLPSTEYRRMGAGVEGWYQLEKGTTSLGVRWNWEEFHVQDFQASVIPLLYPAVNPTILFMADNFRDYRAHILSVMLRRTF